MFNNNQRKGLKAWVRFDGNNNAVAGSLIFQKDKPKVGKWKEYQDVNLCCPVVTTCTEPLIMVATLSEQYFQFRIDTSSINTVKGTVEWGDGASETFDFTGVGGGNLLGHTYTTADYNPQTVKVYFTDLTGFVTLRIGNSVGAIGEVMSVSNLQSVFTGSGIQFVYANGSGISVIDVSGLPVLYLSAINSPNLSAVNVQGCTLLETAELNGDKLQTIDFSGCTALYSITFSHNLIETSTLSTVIIDSCPNITSFDASGAGLSSSNVDYILTTLDNNGLTNGYAGLSGGSNGTPGVGGLSAKTNLESKGWTVEVN